MPEYVKGVKINFSKELRLNEDKIEDILAEHLEITKQHRKFHWSRTADGEVKVKVLVKLDPKTMKPVEVGK